MYLVLGLIGVVFLVWFLIFRDKPAVKDALDYIDSDYPDPKNK